MALAVTALTVSPVMAAPAPIDLRSSSCPYSMTQGLYNSGCVTELQNLLNARGAKLVVDGDFGPLTLAAVKAFQSSNGLVVDGWVGPLTKAALYASPTPPPPVATRTPAPVATKTPPPPVATRTPAPVATKTPPPPVATRTPAPVATKTPPPPNGAPKAINLLSASCPYTIKQGQYSGCVTELQNLLNARGAKLVVDGDFGPLTLAAVKAFQSSKDLEPDGLVGPLTKAALYAGATPPPPVATRTPLPSDGGYIDDLIAKAAEAVQKAAEAVQAARRARFLEIAQEEEDTEPRILYGSTRQKEYAAALDISYTQSWCATFVSWVAIQSGATSFTSVSVGDWVAAAQNGTSVFPDNLSVTLSPMPGDLVAFDWEGDGDFDWPDRHIGIFKSWNPDGTFQTIEGNTGPCVGCSPKGVYEKTRSQTDGYSVLFIRMG
jgi:peptidoglycan hydrolase-like protein with peptidoglycan-binding domain